MEFSLELAYFGSILQPKLLSLFGGRETFLFSESCGFLSSLNSGLIFADFKRTEFVLKILESTLPVFEILEIVGYKIKTLLDS